MASSTPTSRRVLGERDINARGTMQPSKIGTGGLAKPQQVGEISLQTELKHTEDAWDGVYQETRLGSLKRDSDVHMDELLSKRHKTMGRPEVASEAVLYGPRRGQAFGGGVDDAIVLRSPISRQNLDYDGRSSPPASSSPVSSLGSRQAGLDDSQNTTITEPDDVPFPAAIFVPTLSRPVSVALTKEEIREKAEVLKLRLKLASYKVRTNQIDVPMSRLQIKTLTSTQPELPRLPRQVANTSQRRNTLPTTLPDIRLQTPSTEKRRAHHTRIPSSPPPYLDISTIKRQIESASPIKEIDPMREGETEGCTTPILPRQRQGLLHPPNLGSPVLKDLTSSVVKGRAANGLLSLMRQ